MSSTDTSMSRSLCQSLLKIGLIDQKTIQLRNQFQRISDDLLNCFKKPIDNRKIKYDGLKKVVNRMLSVKARQMNLNDQILKKMKQLMVAKINRIKRMKRTRFLVKQDQDEVLIKMEQSSQADQQCQSSEQQEINQKEFQRTGDFVTKKLKGRKITKKYKTFDSDFKQKVCQAAIEKGIQAACQKFKFSKRKITGWLEAYNLNLLGKGRKALDPIMQFNMSIWILKKIWNQIPLTQKVIRQKAATMTTIDIPFNGSKGWLEKFFLRHVQLKSCFDTRGKFQLKEQCARYHRSAFIRLQKDCQNLLKLEIDLEKLIHTNLQAIIYKNETHPLLKPEEDRNLDKHRTDSGSFYDYNKIKDLNIGGGRFMGLKKIEEDDQVQEEDDAGKQLDIVKLESAQNTVYKKQQEQEESNIQQDQQLFQQSQQSGSESYNSDDLIQQQSQQSSSESYNCRRSPKAKKIHKAISCIRTRSRTAKKLSKQLQDQQKVKKEEESVAEGSDDEGQVQDIYEQEENEDGSREAKGQKEDDPEVKLQESIV